VKANMRRELLLMHHPGPALAGNGQGARRPLSEAGEREVQRIGVWLARERLMLDRVLCSPDEQALRSAEEAVKAMGGNAAEIHCDERLRRGTLPDVLELLGAIAVTTGRVLLVGGGPGLQSLLGHLLDTDPPEPSETAGRPPTATLARLAMPEAWNSLKKGCASLLSLTRADELPKKFPYPSPDGDELRDRPAYYYNQSAVIPYRMTDDGPQILVISSLKKRRTIVPKGVKEPGLSPQASAAKEALEEAGVEGIVEGSPLGTYIHRKWGAPCSVEVYTLRVTRVLPEAQWSERHRGREWVTPEQASVRLARPALASMVITLAERLRGA